MNMTSSLQSLQISQQYNGTYTALSVLHFSGDIVIYNYRAFFGINAEIKPSDFTTIECVVI